MYRINECDKRKNTNYVDRFIFKTNKIADETVFISNWLAEYFIEKGFNKSYKVIYNGCNPNHYYPEKIIDYLLEERNNNQACDNFNIVYVLKYCNQLTKSRY